MCCDNIFSELCINAVANNHDRSLVGFNYYSDVRCRDPTTCKKGKHLKFYIADKWHPAAK